MNWEKRERLIQGEIILPGRGERNLAGEWITAIRERAGARANLRIRKDARSKLGGRADPVVGRKVVNHIGT